MKLFLIGYMGCGKSSLGRRVARRLDVRFVDTDSVIEEREGASISDIFQYEGEEYFRRLERSIIEEVASEESDAVVSTGGGAPAWGDNMDIMNRAGTTVYIRRPAEQIVSRLSPYGRMKRPKLRGLSDEEIVDFMKRNMAEREPFYSRAQHVLDTVGVSDNALADIVVDIFKGNEQ